jgi:hypothetical protein
VSLFGFFFWCCWRRSCLFCGGALSCALCDYAELCDWSVSAACKRVVAFSAFPDAHAYSFNPYEAALRAFVRFLQLSDNFYVAFSDC